MMQLKIYSKLKTKFIKYKNLLVKNNRLEIETLETLTVLFMFAIINIVLTNNFNYEIVYVLLFLNCFMSCVFMIRKDFELYTLIPVINPIIGIGTLLIQYNNYNKFRKELSIKYVDLLKDINAEYFLMNKFLDKPGMFIVKINFSNFCNDYMENILKDISYLNSEKVMLYRINKCEYIFGIYDSSITSEEACRILDYNYHKCDNASIWIKNGDNYGRYKIEETQS